MPLRDRRRAGGRPGATRRRRRRRRSRAGCESVARRSGSLAGTGAQRRQRRAAQHRPFAGSSRHGGAAMNPAADAASRTRATRPRAAWPSDATRHVDAARQPWRRGAGHASYFAMRPIGRGPRRPSVSRCGLAPFVRRCMLRLPRTAGSQDLPDHHSKRDEMRSNTEFRLRIIPALVALAFGAGGTAVQAQTASAPADAQKKAQGAGEGQTELQQLVITARKEAENLQKVSSRRSHSTPAHSRSRASSACRTSTTARCRV